MGILTDSMFGALMSWVRALVSAIWALFNSEGTTVLEFMAKNWIGVVLVLLAAGLVVDWLVWLVVYKPYHIWARRVRRLFGHDWDEDEQQEDEDAAAREAYESFDEAYMPQEDAGDDEEAQWMPLSAPVIEEEEALAVMDAADQVPDEALGQYPGRRYDGAAVPQDTLAGTRRFGALHEEGPGAAEVSRRRDEIDAWQRQMQEEAAARAEAERRERAAQEAERVRAQQEERLRAEREARIAYEAEQARLAQEAYAREMEEYERQRAQYERELAEYERQKAAYEAALSAQREQEMRAQQEADCATEFAQENPQPTRSTRRRRAASYSDMVTGDAVEELPAAPQWPQMQPVAEAPAREEKPAKSGLWRSGMAKMARMIEAESEDVTGIAALPPRVDKNEAYRPAKRPEGSRDSVE